MGFEGLVSDNCVFRRGDVWLLLYLDDISLMGRNELSIRQVKREIGEHLEVKDLGQLRLFLGVVFSNDT